MDEICSIQLTCVKLALSIFPWAVLESPVLGSEESEILTFSCGFGQRCVRIGQHPERLAVTVERSYIHIHLAPLYCAHESTSGNIRIHQCSEILVPRIAAAP